MKFISTAFLLFNCFTIFSQLAVNITWQPVKAAAMSDTIYYDLKEKLVWENFKVNKEDGTDAAALTSSGFGFGAGLYTRNNKGSLNINVFCYFLKPLSWYKAKSRNAYVLNHEQHHFDIAYIGANCFLSKLKAAKVTLENYNTILQNLYTEAYTYMKDLQNQYDTETRNGRLTDKQQEWNNKIDLLIMESSK
jgi:hypothetical protein